MINEYICGKKRYKLIGMLKNVYEDMSMSFIVYNEILDINFKFLFVGIDGYLVPFEIEKIREENEYELTVWFKNISNYYLNEERDFQKVIFPEYDNLEIIGYKILDVTNTIEPIYLGEVVDILENNFQACLKIKKEEKYFYIPYVNEFIKETDEKRKEIKVVIPKNLLL